MPHLVSNSMVNSFNTCTYQFQQEHVKKLKKAKDGPALAIGNLLDYALEDYYKYRLQGKSHEESVSHAKQRIIHALEHEQDKYPLPSILIAKRRLEEYFDYYGEDPNWRVMAVQKRVNLKVTDDIYMPMRLDLLVWDVEKNGAVLVDTKATYDFWSEVQLKLPTQFPNYVAALRANGINVVDVIVNQIRYREIKDAYPEQLFARTPVPMPEARIAMSLTNYIRTARKIARYLELPPEQQEEETTRLLREKTCQYCPFQVVCQMEMHGEDPTIYIAEKFGASDYGYSDSDDNRVGSP